VLPGYKVKVSHTETKDSGNRDNRVTSDGEIDRQGPLRLSLDRPQMKTGIHLNQQMATLGIEVLYFR
jgi:hypothetical protein